MERNDQVRNSHLVTPNKITDLGADHNEMLRSESEVAQSCPTLCNPMDCSLPGSSVHGESPGKVLEWVAMPSSSILARRILWREEPSGLQSVGSQKSWTQLSD